MMKYESSYNPLEVNGDVKLRVSKSSFMSARSCLRKYWWNKVAMPDVRLPDTPASIRGTAVHNNLEHLYDLWEEGPIPIPEVNEEYFDTLFAISELEEQRRLMWGDEFFKPIEAEQKHSVYDPELDVVLVGAWDGLFMHPSGGLCIMELKTGDLSTGKLSRVRRELSFYRRMLKLLDYPPVTHAMLISSDCINERTAQSVLKQKNKEVFLGAEMGITIVEKVNARTTKAFEKDLFSVVDSIKNHDWSPSWSDYFCGQYCDFYLSCDNELHGDGESAVESWLNG